MNLLRGEFYKLFKGKAFYICCLAGAFSVVFIYVMLFFADAALRKEEGSGSQGVSVSVTEGNMPKADVPFFEEITVLDVLQQMFGNFGSFITVIFAAVFVIEEYGNGAVKNVVGKGYKRWQIFGAKYVAATAAGALLLALICVMTVAVGGVLQKTAGISQEWNGAFFKELSVYAGIQILLGAAVVGVAAAISEICRHMGAGIAICFGIAAFSTLITGGLDILVKFAFPGTKFRLADYWLMDLIISCPLREISGTYLLHAFFAAVLWIAFSFAAGVRHFQKADIS